MAQFGRYILSVTAAAMVLGILNSLLEKKGSAASLFRLIGGLFLTFTIIQPMAGFEIADIAAFAEDFYAAGEAAAASGEWIASEERAAIIKEEIQAYILDKAEACGAALTVEVSLDDDSLPAAVRLAGNISPYAKTQLQNTIEADLGISKENQLWTGQP